MATTDQWKYFYQHAPGIPPGGALNLVYGPSSEFNDGTFTVTAHPSPRLRNTRYYMWVKDMSMGAIDVGVGDIDNVLKTLHATFFNSGNTGDGTIYAWSIRITRVTS